MVSDREDESTKSLRTHCTLCSNTVHCYTNMCISFPRSSTCKQLRSNNNRTRGQLLGLSKRNGTRSNTWKSPKNSGSSRNHNPMTTTPSASSSSSSGSAVKTASQPTRIGQPSVEGFSQQELLELKESFNLFDMEGTGSIAVGPFRAVVESLLVSTEQSYPHLEEILRLLSGRSEEEEIDFDGYLSLMASTSLQQRLLDNSSDDDQPNFQHVFDLFDAEGKGCITVEDLRRVALELGENDMTMDELQEMVERARSKKTGQVTLKEFSKMMTLNLFQKVDGEAITTDNNFEAPAQEEN
jgi:centrin-1